MCVCFVWITAGQYIGLHNREGGTAGGREEGRPKIPRSKPAYSLAGSPTRSTRRNIGALKIPTTIWNRGTLSSGISLFRLRHGRASARVRVVSAGGRGEARARMFVIYQAHKTINKHWRRIERARGRKPKRAHTIKLCIQASSVFCFFSCVCAHFLVDNHRHLAHVGRGVRHRHIIIIMRLRVCICVLQSRGVRKMDGARFV